MCFLESLSPSELATFSNVVAIALSKDKTANELNVLGNFIVSVGGLMLTIAAQEQSLQEIEDKKKQISELKDQIKNLESEM